MSTCGAAGRAPARDESCGSRCSVCGPNTTSTYGARLTMPAPSCDATQPPTPITRSGLPRLERAHAAQVVEHALLRLLAHRARVEQDDVGVLRPVGEREAVGRVEHVGHAVRVVLVHLASERSDEELLGQGCRTPGRLVNPWGAVRAEVDGV